MYGHVLSLFGAYLSATYNVTLLKPSLNGNIQYVVKYNANTKPSNYANVFWATL